MVRFIVGKANRDVSAAMRGELVSLLKSGEKRKAVYIVPDQFEYETERAMYRRLDKNGLLTRSGEVKITTFADLSDDILRRGGDTRPRADGTVKNIMMHKVLMEQKSGLNVLAGVASKQGFCEKMLRTASMFKTAGITAAELERRLDGIEKSEGANASLPVMRKLAETGLLYAGYEAEMAGYTDEPDIAGLAAQFVAKNTVRFEDADIFVDCFNDLTYNQMLLMNELILRSKNITMGFVTDTDSDAEVFRTANKNIAKLKARAEDSDIPVVFTKCEELRTKPDTPLFHLAENLFADGKRTEARGRVELISAVNVYEEADFIAAKIKQLTTNGKMRYGDIAVLCTDLGSYKKYIESAFKKYDIPFFADARESIIHMPLINAVISLLNALRNFSADTALSVVKTGFFSKYSKAKQKRAGLSAGDINVFENYVYEWALETGHMKKPFTFAAKADPTDIGADLEEEYDEHDCCVETFDGRTRSERQRDQAEEIRASIVEPVWELSRKVTGKKSVHNGAELTELLYDFLINKVDITCAIHAKCRIRQKDGTTVIDREHTALYQKLWDALMGIFNKLHAELLNTDISFPDYCRLFRDVCAGTTLAAPPQYIDSVLVGDIDRTRADNIKAAFIAGTSYDSFPTKNAAPGIFSEYDMEVIRGSLFSDADGITGLKSPRGQYELSVYRAYRAICLPSEYLCLTCPDRDPSGELLEPSAVMTEICGTFTDIGIKRAGDFDDKFYCRSLKALKARYAYRSDMPSWENAALRKALIKCGEQDFTDMIDEIRSTHRAKPLNSEELYAASNEELPKDHSGKHAISPVIARLLFPTSFGASSVERLSECRFKFFCQYGLNIKERVRRDFNSNKRGEAVHYIFEQILKNYRSQIFTFDRNVFYNLSLHYLEEYRRLETNNDFSENTRTDFLFRNTANTAADVLLTMQSELYSRKFVPKFFELDINDRNNKKYITADEPEIVTALPEPTLWTDANDAPLPRPAPPPPETNDFILTAPFTVRLKSGILLTIGGRIDRADLMKSPDSERGYYLRVVDYKTSVHCFDSEKARKYGINTQMLLYLIALRQANKNNPNITLLPGGVSYLPSRNEGAVDSPFGAYRLLAMNYHESGLLITDKATTEDHDAYVEHIKRRIMESDPDYAALSAEDKQKYEDTLDNGILKSYGAENGSQIENGKFDELCDGVTDRIKTKFNTLYGGGVSAIPQTYYEKRFDINGKIKKANNPKDPCGYCKFSEVCRNRKINVFEIKDDDSKKKKEDGTDGE